MPQRYAVAMWYCAICDRKVAGLESESHPCLLCTNANSACHPSGIS